MTQVIRETRTVEQGEKIASTNAEQSTTIAARVVYLISGVINFLLLVRFVFSLLGANTSNAIADFVYSVTEPLLSPFFGLFNYKANYGTVRFEFETLIAIAFYSLAAWLIVKIITIGDRTATE